ncbi:putative small lipoprotein YifL [Chitinivorax tropicus]|uniref:Putative small lipoprotein YifL n=1 Tax=Chitinivorax tropicus TaxID=714531 RepID=A0A840MNK7_9PROT|nr:lipoprotein [Chitinivorax tropicus]MBB5018332.1 putative small lipoprotein YifL [Chitinivorax tropicus]
MRLICILTLLTLLNACGFKGPLYLPSPEPAKPAATAQQAEPSTKGMQPS